MVMRTNEVIAKTAPENGSVWNIIFMGLLSADRRLTYKPDNKFWLFKPITVVQGAVCYTINM